MDLMNAATSLVLRKPDETFLEVTELTTRVSTISVLEV